MECVTVNVLPAEELVRVLKVEVSPAEAYINEFVEVKVTLSNPTTVDATKEICADVYSVSGAVQRIPCFLRKTVTIPAGQTIVVSLGRITFGVPDTYVVEVEGVTAQFVLKRAPVEVELEKLSIDPQKDIYYAGETIKVNYRVYFNQPVKAYAWVQVNGEKIAEKTIEGGVEDTGLIIDTAFTIPAEGTYEICGDYKIMSQ